MSNATTNNGVNEMKIIRETTVTNPITGETSYSNKVVLLSNATIQDWRELSGKISMKVERLKSGTPIAYFQNRRIEAKIRGRNFIFRLVG